MAIEERAVALLSNNLLQGIKRHYEERPISRDSVFEVLNALGVACATVMAPAMDHGPAELAEARKFLDTAIDNYLDVARKMAAEQAEETPSSGGSFRAH